MKPLKIGDSLPNFELLNQDEKLVNSQSLIGKALVLYFYPKDDTPGCTAEACSFRNEHQEFIGLNARVVGVSADSPKAHKDFANKYQLPFDLLSDSKNELRKMIGVPSSFFGLIPGRATYVFDEAGKLVHIFNAQLKAKQHITEALEQLRSMG